MQFTKTGGPLLLVVVLAGCVAQVRTTPPVGVAEEIDLVPPVPTFTTAADCEMAYGAGACGSGAQIYAAAGLGPPPDAFRWYVPYAYGTMTGVLVNRHYAPPTVYISTVQYQTFVSPVVIQRYRVVDRATIEAYHRAPLSVRNEIIVSGPVRYAPARGVITARPYYPARAPAAAGERPGAPGAPQHPPTRPQSAPVTATEATPVSAGAPTVTAAPPAKPGERRTGTPAAPATGAPPAAAAATGPNAAAAAAHAAPAPVAAVHPAEAKPKGKPAKACDKAKPKSETNC